MRTFVYVDGFNLYYRALRGTPYKWLDLSVLAQNLLSPENQVSHVRYFTAPVSGRLDPQQPLRQQLYLRALRTLPNVTVHLGSFLNSIKSRPLANPVAGQPTHVDIFHSEERVPM